jgi:uncharacterized protein YlxW (UPF0749 family)
MGRRRGQLAVALVLALLGFLVVTQARSQAQGQGLSQLSVQDLTELVANVTARNNQLRQEVATLQQQKETLETSVQRGTTSTTQMRSDLTHILAWSGAVGVIGTGIEVRVSGPLPAPALGQLLNELWNAGAEALSVNGVRIVPGVVPAGQPGQLTIGGTPVFGPLVMDAVGQSETLAGSLSRVGGIIAQLAVQYPTVSVQVVPEDRVSVPATNRNLAPTLGRPHL